MADPFKPPFRVATFYGHKTFHVVQDSDKRNASPDFWDRDEAQWFCDRLNADRYAEGKAAGLEEATNAQPSTAENPNEDAYQRGRFDGIIEYAKAIGALAMVKP